jgi:hypothetical protein
MDQIQTAVIQPRIHLARIEDITGEIHQLHRIQEQLNHRHRFDAQRSHDLVALDVKISNIYTMNHKNQN